MKFTFDKSKFKIGMRTAKTGLAVFLVLLLFRLFGWQGTQIAALTAVFSLREDFNKSLSFGASRVLGNTIGGVMAIIFYLISDFFKGHFLVELFLVPFLTMMTIVFNVAFNNVSGIIGASSAFLLITLAPPGPGRAWFYVVSRVLQTFVGVLIAILVNSDITQLKKWLKKQGYVR